jgi:hypothetical protein
MSKITFQCYSCNQTLRVDASKGGQRAKCPGCSTMLTIPTAAPETAVTPAAPTVGPAPVVGPAPTVGPANDVPMVSAAVDGPSVRVSAAAPVVTAPVDDDALDEDQDQDVAGKKKKKIGKNWLFTRVGLLVLFIALCLLCFAVLFDQIGHLLLMIQDFKTLDAMSSTRPTFERPSEAYKTFLKLGSILLLLALIPPYVGHVLAIFGPRNGAIIGLGIATPVLGALGWLIYLLFHVLTMFENYIIKMESATSFESLRFSLIFWYHLVPDVFFALPFLVGTLHVYFIGRLTKSRATNLCLGATGAIGAYLLLDVLVSIILMVMKPESASGFKTMTYLTWGTYWLEFLLLFAGLGIWTFATFAVRMAARK